MTQLWAPDALLPDGWAENVRVTIEEGHIASVASGTQPDEHDQRLEGRALLPAMANLHSHTFQRAMAGMTERRGAGPDSFWTWRDLMYRFVAVLTPEDIEAIAALAFVEMLEAGYASVAEFHYLHRQADGTPYANLAELCERICAAATHTGIGLTLLPTLYSRAGADGSPLGEGQGRFGNTVDGLVGIAEQATRALRRTDTLGIAAHSLRAVAPEHIKVLQSAFPQGPVHIHAAEQVAEIEEIVGVYGARPIDLLLDRLGLDARWCVVHATHMTTDETARLAKSGAVAGLCPITEANLGDGIFPGSEFIAHGGAIGIGTDSNIQITVAGELRLLEYGQRLTHRARNVLSAPASSTGETLYRSALAGGAQALGRPCGAIAPGMVADLVALERQHETLTTLATGQLMDGLVFAGGDAAIADVWSAGSHLVRQGRHADRGRVVERYRSTMKAILERL